MIDKSKSWSMKNIKRSKRSILPVEQSENVLSEQWNKLQISVVSCGQQQAQATKYIKIHQNTRVSLNFPHELLKPTHQFVPKRGPNRAWPAKYKTSAALISRGGSAPHSLFWPAPLLTFTHTPSSFSTLILPKTFNMFLPFKPIYQNFRSAHLRVWCSSLSVVLGCFWCSVPLSSAHHVLLACPLKTCLVSMICGSNSCRASNLTAALVSPVWLWPNNRHL